MTKRHLSAIIVFCASTFTWQTADAQLLRLRSHNDKADCTAAGESDACQNGCATCCPAWRQSRRFEGQHPAANCGCNGSYKFPVPPLYTYHWPGLYAQQRMTDYQGPWRFPPIRPYTEDVKRESRAPTSVRPVAHTSSNRSRFVPVSERLKKYYGSRR